MRDDRLLHRRPDVLATDIDGEGVLMVPGQRRLFALDPVSARIWELLAEPIAVPAICERLCQEYAVDPVSCRQDVDAFVAELLAAGLIAEP